MASRLLKVAVEWIGCWKPKLLLSMSIAAAGVWPGVAGSASHQLVVQVRPEVALSRQNDGALVLKIRLAGNAHAVVWNARTCQAPDPKAYLVVRSGIYTIPVFVVPGPGDGGTCLASSDGVLSLFLPRTDAAR